MPVRLFLVGRRFGKLKVIGDAPMTRTPGGWPIRWSRCRCDCGKECLVRNQALTIGKTQSCGCKRYAITHGHSAHGVATGTYTSWKAMIQRCCNPRSKHFTRYGACGITVCKRWREFENFLKDMGAKPSGLTIERMNNALGYRPGNCRWATRAEQVFNRHNTQLIEYRGTSGRLTDLLKQFQIAINADTIRRRLRRGWKIEAAFTEKPIFGRRPTWNMLH